MGLSSLMSLTRVLISPRKKPILPPDMKNMNYRIVGGVRGVVNRMRVGLISLPEQLSPSCELVACKKCECRWA